jgi:hypothetical protein
VIFGLYSRVKLKLGDEEHIFDQSRLMLTEVTEIEKVTELSHDEWKWQLGRGSVTAVAALLHILRKRAEIPSDFKTMQFNVAQLEIVPLHEDDSEFTPEEVTADLQRRMDEAKAQQNGAVPTSATAASAVAPEDPKGTTITSPSSPPAITSVHGNGSSSPGVTSRSSRRTRTAS